ncbi:hypothetical protein D9613_010388 [Agrocybe pediades]|uniref:Uncharacterized protein n=1 Tax=Agrocybe pediades TaxID=84607 RepID=A0A8H4QGE7_9AGAR|nr:hypothetical protein D9613_010388 [Agrocybe pediades]
MPNPRPNVTSFRCPACGNHSLTKVQHCEGGGKVLTNWDRWFQVCTNPTCGHFEWHNPPTPLDQIPEHVKERQANCLTMLNNPRKANRNCSRLACASCCKSLGGCTIVSHRVTYADITAGTASHHQSLNNPLLAPTASSNISLPKNLNTYSAVAASGHALTLPSSQGPDENHENRTNLGTVSNTQGAIGGSQPPTQLSRRSYAQPLDPNYGGCTQEAWVKAHLHRQEQMQRFANEKLIIEQRSLAKDVKVWYQAGSPPKTIRVMLSTPDIFVPDEHPALREVLGYDAQFLDVFHVTPSSSSWTMQMWSVPVGTVKHQPV